MRRRKKMREEGPRKAGGGPSDVICQEDAPHVPAEVLSHGAPSAS